MFSAHLDTVFPEETDVRVTREGSILKGPGIGDDCRGLAVVLAVIRALNQANVQTNGTITFVGTVGEEGLGDLRGVKALFGETLAGQVDRFVSVDGTGLGITHIAVGSLRYRVTFSGPGGHSYGAFGIANPMHALGRAISSFADTRPPSDPKTTFSVGRVGGGTSVNAISADAWMEVDMRSADQEALRALESRFHTAVAGALAAENARWEQKGRISVTETLVGARPAGAIAATAPIVQATVSVTRALGAEVELSEGSTDANIPLSLNIPAITIDAGGSGTGLAHGGRSLRHHRLVARHTARRATRDRAVAVAARGSFPAPQRADVRSRNAGTDDAEHECRVTGANDRKLLPCRKRLERREKVQRRRADEHHREQRVDAAARQRGSDCHRRCFPLRTIRTRFVLNLQVPADPLGADMQRMDCLEPSDENSQREETRYRNLTEQKQYDRQARPHRAGDGHDHHPGRPAARHGAPQRGELGRSQRCALRVGFRGEVLLAFFWIAWTGSLTGNFVHWHAERTFRAPGRVKTPCAIQDSC